MAEANPIRKDNGLSHHIDHVHEERGVASSLPAGEETARNAEQYLNKGRGTDGKGRSSGANWPLLAGTAGALALGFALGRHWALAAGATAVAAATVGGGAAAAGQGAARRLAKAGEATSRAARTGVKAAGHATKTGAKTAGIAAATGAVAAGQAGSMAAHKVAGTAATAARPVLRGVGEGLIKAGTTLRGAARPSRPRWLPWLAAGALGLTSVAVASRSR